MRDDLPMSVLFRIISHDCGKMLNDTLIDLDLTSSQAGILGFLHDRQNEIIYQKDIEREFDFRHPTVTGLLRRMQEKDLVVCTPDKRDRRFKRVKLTEKSCSLHEQMQIYLQSMDEILLAGLPVEQKDVFRQSLQMVLKNIHNKE